MHSVEDGGRDRGRYLEAGLAGGGGDVDEDAVGEGLGAGVGVDDGPLGLVFGGGRLRVGHDALPCCRNRRSCSGIGGRRRRMLPVVVVRVPGWRDREVNGVEVFGELGRD